MADLVIDDTIEAIVLPNGEELEFGKTPTGNIDITQAGVTDVSEYATATVPNVGTWESVLIRNSYTTKNGKRYWNPQNGLAVFEAGWIGEGTYTELDTFNAVPANTAVTPTESSQTIGGANYMMEGAVTVNAIPSNYVGSGVTQRSSSDLTASGATVTAPSGYYSAQATKTVPSGTAGTPTATKGTVSNHSVSVTPSVTNTAGYIQSQTKTGTAVTVTASELVSGSQTITENGTVNVTNLAQVVVDVASASGDHTVTIASSGHSSRCYVQLNGAGQTYYSSGSTIPFSHSAGDELYIYCTGSRGGGTITVNGVQVASNPYDPVSYTLALPFADVTVNLSYGSTSQVDVTFTVPTIEITENGVHDVSSYAYADVNVSGGGGASNFVQGTFTTQSSAGVQSISVPYTGGGYPVSIMVYVAGGAYNSAISAWYDSKQRYAVGQWTCHKSVQTSAPTYATSGTQNQGVTTAIYKNSTSSSTSYTRTSAMNTNVFSSSYASNAALTCVRYRSGNVLSVYVNTSSYGLLPGIEYQYQIVYSS